MIKNPILNGFYNRGLVPYNEELETYTVRVVKSPHGGWKIVDLGGVLFSGHDGYNYKERALEEARRIAINGAKLKGAIPIVKGE